jgi:hypothetical protein
MKRIIFMGLVALFALFNAEKAEAQGKKDLRNKDLKAIKVARQEARKREKQGWDVAPGGIPMAKAFENAWELELEERSNGSLRYITATGSAVAGTKSAGDQAAMTAARNELAAALGAKVSELIETKRANDQIDQKTANTLDKTISNSKSLIQAELTQIKTGYKIYKKVYSEVDRKGRPLPDAKENVQVEVKIFYDQEEAMKVAQKVIRKELEKESDELGKQLDDILNINPRKRGEELKKD